ncbi:O-antigen ligase family protein [Butyrivibrio sp. AE2032]|uniref:O-antigen ligase family protein n=1 Tax=Butyrivibrio sp. AE2032 TaxID=1458463 RepID=UPI0005528CFA|nr:O-antigen ligase family protein [Butyrivibrio sp. AE2032]
MKTSELVELKHSAVCDYLFFAYFILIVIDGMFDLSILYPLLSLSIILLDSMFVHKKEFILVNPLRMKKGIRVYALFLAYEVANTVFFAISSRSVYATEAVYILLNQIIVFFMMLYFAPYITWDTLILLLRNFGVMLAIIGALESYTKHAFFPTMKHWTKSTLALNGTEAFRSYTVFTHPIVNSFFLLFFLSLLYYYPLKNKIFNLCVWFIALYAIIGAGAKSGWLTLSGVLAIIFIKQLTQKINISRFLGFFMALVFIVLLFFLLKEPFSELYFKVYRKMSAVIVSNSKDLSRKHRLLMIVRALYYLSKDYVCLIFGRGSYYGLQFAREHSLNDSWAIIDNQFITYWLGTGIIGVLLFLYNLIISIGYIFRKCDKYKGMASLSLMVFYVEIFFFEGMQWKVCCFIFMSMLFLLNKQDELSVIQNE